MPGELTNLVAEGLRVDARFGDLGLGTVRLGRALAEGIDGAGTVRAYIDGVQPPDPVVGTRQLIRLEGIVAETGGQPLASIGSLASEGDKAADGAIAGALVMEGLRLALPRGTVPWLEQLGYAEIAGGAEIRGTAQRQGGMLAIAPIRASWDQAGTLTLGGRFTGIPLTEAGQAADDQAMAQMMNSRVVAFSLGWREQGLLGRTIAWQARQSRQPEARLREQWAQMALTFPIPGAQTQRGGPPPGKGGTAQAAGPDPFQPIREALASFIRQPREIEFAVAPAKPLTFTEVQALVAAGPAEAIRALNLTVRLP